MSAKQKDVGSSPAHDQKFFVQFFSAWWDFRNFFKCLQRVPLHFFLFCKRMDVQKLPKAPFYIFRNYATYRGPKKWKEIRKKISKKTVEENTWHIEVILLFLSLRYGADLGRSRLVK